jgi:hypothetical protein
VIGSTIDESSFSGLFTRVDIGHIRIGSAGKGRSRSRGRPACYNCPMRRLRLLALLAFLVLSTCPVSANVLTPADAKALSEAVLQATTIGAEMFSMQKPSANTLWCALGLTTPLDKFLAALRPVTLLTRLAARMANSTDEQEAGLRLLRGRARGQAAQER